MKNGMVERLKKEIKDKDRVIQDLACKLRILEEQNTKTYTAKEYIKMMESLGGLSTVILGV